jgi:hypothetical protein
MAGSDAGFVRYAWMALHAGWRAGGRARVQGRLTGVEDVEAALRVVRRPRRENRS